MRSQAANSALPLDGGKAGAALGPVGEPPSRTDLVASALLNAILNGAWPPGHPLNEREIAQSLGVSKTPVREALIGLQRSGLVVMTAFKGARVRGIDDQWVREVCEFRLMLEPQTVARAAHDVGSIVATAERAENILTRAAEAGSTGQYPDLSRLNRAFHRELYAGCGNALVIETLDNLRDQISYFAVATWRSGDTWEKEAHEHRDILRAFKAGDAPETQRLLEEHLAGFRDRLMRLALDSRRSSTTPTAATPGR